MHASSVENMDRCYRRYIQGGPIEAASKAIVLDCSNNEGNGSYRSIFPKAQFDYIAAGQQHGDGVRAVRYDPYALPFQDSSIDIAVSGQAFEHYEFFWLAFAEMARVVKPEGYIFLIAPSAGPVHRFPVDCYRFYPGSYPALAKYAKCKLIEMWWDERGPWRDLVGVFRRLDAPEALPPAIETRSPAKRVRQKFNSTPEEEVVRGQRRYLDVLADIHRELEPALYIEIGVHQGRSLALAQCPAIGVDPFPEVTIALPADTSVVALRSDDFFSGPHKHWLTQPPSLAFIDGMHHFEFALRDFMHIERESGPGTLAVFDDIFPNHPAQALRERRTCAWTGDVWKLVPCLRKWRPDLFLLPIDASPAGLLIVGGLNKNNRVLWNNYNPIVHAYTALSQDPPREVLLRAGAHSGASETLAKICKILRKARHNGQSSASIVAELRAAMLREGAPPDQPGG
ncbi:MAG TPA: methyltransferase domain-containing protein [Methylocella sp.]|nr:methyltransferase domain-containing protein [Methylocella sp.]